MKYSLETVHHVCNDDTGEVIEVGPDGDGLDLVEIRTRDPQTRKVLDRVVFSREAIPLLIEALTKLAQV